MMDETSQLVEFVKEKSVDAHFKHPFTCLVVGPSESGKSTFVHDLLIYLEDDFTDVVIYLGTSVDQNPTFLSLLEKKLSFKLTLVNLSEKYGPHPGTSEELLKDVTQLCTTMQEEHKKLCLVFDDLMTELNNSSLISDLFSKYSSHTKTTVIFITQNLFYKGKKQSESVTMYRNTKYLVLFRSGMDQTTFQVVAKRIGVSTKFLVDVTNVHRYIVIRADHHGPKFTTDIFNTVCIQGENVPIQTQLDPISAERKV